MGRIIGHGELRISPSCSRPKSIIMRWWKWIFKLIKTWIHMCWTIWNLWKWEPFPSSIKTHSTTPNQAISSWKCRLLSQQVYHLEVALTWGRRQFGMQGHAKVWSINTHNWYVSSPPKRLIYSLNKRSLETYKQVGARQISMQSPTMQACMKSNKLTKETVNHLLLTS